MNEVRLGKDIVPQLEKENYVKCTKIPPSGYVFQPPWCTLSTQEPEDYDTKLFPSVWIYAYEQAYTSLSKDVEDGIYPLLLLCEQGLLNLFEQLPLLKTINFAGTKNAYSTDFQNKVGEKWSVTS